MARPTHTLTVKKKDGESPAKQIGVAWQNDKGWFNIKLNPCVALSDREDIWINMYPIEYDDRPQVERRPRNNGNYDREFYDEEDIPF